MFCSSKQSSFKGRYFLLLFLLMTMIACNKLMLACDRLENSVPQESELNTKFQELNTFLVKRSSFRGIDFDTDLWIVSFAFKSEIKDPSLFFTSVKEEAKKAGWRLVDESSGKHVEFDGKDIGFLPDANRPYYIIKTVEITFDPETSEYLLKSQTVSHTKPD